MAGYARPMSARQTKAPGKPMTWLVYRVGGARGRVLGIVKATDYAGALAAAIVELQIAPADRRRIMVRPAEL